MLTYQNENTGKSFAFRSRFHHPGYSVPVHIHEYSEIMYVAEGCMTMYLDGEKLLVDEGKVAFVFPNQAHEYTCETDCHMWCAVFSNDFLASFYHLYPDVIPEDPIMDTSEAFGIIDALQNTASDDIISLTGILHLLFAQLVKKTAFSPRRAGMDALYNSAINYISANFRNDFTLGDMARALGYHEKYLSSELHFLTKMNFRAFLSTYRIDHAKRLLRKTERSISEIALDSGYSSINTFNRTFRNFVGMTPSEYRRSRG